MIKTSFCFDQKDDRIIYIAIVFLVRFKFITLKQSCYAMTKGLTPEVSTLRSNLAILIPDSG